MAASNYPQAYESNRYAAFSAPYKAKTTKTTKPVKPSAPMTFEEAMQHLRRGRSIQRRAWHDESMIFALGDKVFIKLPNGLVEAPRPVDNSQYGSAPTFWKPYPQDFLADDWRVVKWTFASSTSRTTTRTRC